MVFHVFCILFSHISVSETIQSDSKSVTVELRGEVGLLSHNIRIIGSNDAQWHENIAACAEGFDTGRLYSIL